MSFALSLGAPIKRPGDNSRPPASSRALYTRCYVYYVCDVHARACLCSVLEKASEALCRNLINAGALCARRDKGIKPIDARRTAGYMYMRDSKKRENFFFCSALFLK